MWRPTDSEVTNSWGYERAQPHIEIDAHPEVYDSAMWERERMESHAADSIKLHPDVYIGGEDVTVTVDPMKNEKWMRDDSSYWRHKVSENRGALKDHRAVMATVHLLDKHSKPSETFIPTSAMIDKMPKLSPLCVANSTRGRRMGSSQGAGVLYPGMAGRLVESERWGKLPVVSAQMYDGRLPHDGRYVESRFENAPLTINRASNRAFDCGPTAAGIECR